MNEFENEIKRSIDFKTEATELNFISIAYDLRRYDIPDKEIIATLKELYNKAKNDVANEFY